MLDKTKTAMGATNAPKSFVEQPLIERKQSRSAWTPIEELNQKAMLREEIREYLGPSMIWNDW